MGSRSTKIATAGLVALSLLVFPAAGSATYKNYSQNSVNGEATPPAATKVLKDYSKNSVSGDYLPPTGHLQPATRIVRVHDDPGFAWGDAGAGAGTAFVLALLAAGSSRLIRRRRMTPPSPARPTTA